MKTKQVGVEKEELDTLVEALEKEAGATFKDVNLAKRILGATLALEHVRVIDETVAEQTHVIVNGTVAGGYKLIGPFTSEDDAHTYATNQFHLTKRWEIVELKKPLVQ